MTVTSEPGTRRDRPLVVSIVVLALAGVLAIIAIAVGSRTAELDSASPEGVVQRYVQAVIDDELDDATSLLAHPDCTAWDGYVERDIRVTLRDTELDGDRATVEVAVSYRSGEPILDAYSAPDRNTFHLDRVDGAWKISRAPWPFWVCEERPRP